MEEPKPLTKSHILLVFLVAILLLVLGVPFIATAGIMVALVVIDFLFQQYIKNKKDRSDNQPRG